MPSEPRPVLGPERPSGRTPSPPSAARWPSWVARSQAAVSALCTAGLWGWVILVALATLFRQSCGEDVRWAVQGLAALVSTVASLAGVVVLAWWAIRRSAPPGWRWSLRVIVAVSLVGIVVAVVAGLVLPTGACPSGSPVTHR